MTDIALRPPPEDRQPVTLGQLVPGLGEIHLADIRQGVVAPAEPPVSVPTAAPAPPAPPAPEALQALQATFLPAVEGVPGVRPPSSPPPAPPAAPDPVSPPAPSPSPAPGPAPETAVTRQDYVAALGRAHTVLVALGDLPARDARAALLVALKVLEGLP